MIRKLYNIKRWKDLKSGKKISDFKSISIENVDKKDLDCLIEYLKINLKNIHIIKRSNYQLPDKIEPANSSLGITTYGSLSIPVYITWEYYFFNESDWSALQITR